MSLKDLDSLAIKAQQSFNSYNKEEILLSSLFKDEFLNLLRLNSTDSISYSTYTSVIKTSNGLTITFPNQWFFIASFFVEFLNELKIYKDYYTSIFEGVENSKELTKIIKESGEIPTDINNKIDSFFQNASDKVLFKKFISDYNWWFGSKTIDRSDYYVSPILNLAKVVNVSQSYIAQLTDLLSKNESLYLGLQESILQRRIGVQKVGDVLIEETKIRDFAMRVFTHFYGNNWEELIDNCEKKSSKINNTNFQSYDFNVFKGLLACFDSQQSKLDLRSSGTLRYFEIPILNLNSNYFYFTTQWNGNGERDLSFKNLKEFFERNFLDVKFRKDADKFRMLRKSIGASSNFNVKPFVLATKASGLIFTDQLIQRFVASLCTKPFVILTGLSGSGKTKLAQAFAQWITESENQYKIIPVGADWTNREPLLGFSNGLDSRSYVTPDSGALQLIMEALKVENQGKPYFMILDEMNLSHVERYFADFLSIIESGERLKLYSGEKRYFKIEEGKEPDIAYLIPTEIEWPKNLFIVGTVNIDETTYMFSPKVLDRANVIEFRISTDNMKKFFKEGRELKMVELFVDGDKDKGGLGQNMGNDFLMAAQDRSVVKIPEIEGEQNVLNDFFSELQLVGCEFGYRSAHEIELLITKLGVNEIKSINESPISNNDKIDIAIMQKLLPKIHGSRKKLVGPLETLAGFCLERLDGAPEVDTSNKLKTKYQQFISEKRNYAIWKVKYSISFEKIERMLKNVIENGFTSYAEA